MVVSTHSRSQLLFNHVHFSIVFDSSFVRFKNYEVVKGNNVKILEAHIYLHVMVKNLFHGILCSKP